MEEFRDPVAPRDLLDQVAVALEAVVEMGLRDP